MCIFVIRYYCKVSKKSSEKNLLAKLKVILDITISREIINLANCLKFKLFEIISLKQFLKLANLTITKENERSTLVKNNLRKSRKNKCETLYVWNYKKNRKFLYITYLHNNKNKQFKDITFYFRLRFTYLKFYKMSNDFNLQHHHTTTIKELLFLAFYLT